jgi:hypothetical protein
MRTKIIHNVATGELVELPYTPEEEADADAMAAAMAAEAPRRAIHAQIDALYNNISNEQWALAQPDTAGGTAAGRAWMKDLIAQIAALKAQL